MPVRNETSTRFMDEVRIISPVACFIATIGFVAVVAVMIVISFTSLSDRNSPSPLLLIPFGVVAGTALACYILLIGYINRDAGHRGMSRLLWTLIAIFVPNALGLVLYFVLRKPRIAKCPQCGITVEHGFGFCPRCRCRLSPVCPHCQRGVNAGDKFCPYCGGDIAGGANAAPAPLPAQN
jgi:Double zinc ribbon/Phospholipase_D-nuclease N-terminal